MKILTRYVIFSILKIAFVTILMFALILAAVELFSRMDSIMNGDLSELIEALKIAAGEEALKEA